MIRYCNPNPRKITAGDLKISLKFFQVNVIPIPNITTVRSGMIADLKPDKKSL